tara:strand:+ start:1630 stop:2304 length:675 start_codon:yes stop_codon:yes gene_type:complete
MQREWDGKKSTHLLQCRDATPLGIYRMPQTLLALPSEFGSVMKVGYARVSTEEQNLDMQRHALKAIGCEKVFEDHGISGMASDRPGLESALSSLKKGDVLVVWKLDRLGRSLPHLIDVVTMLKNKGIGFLSLQEQINTTSSGGRFYLHILAALAEFEREMIRERTKAGMAAARRRGVKLGRPQKLSADDITAAKAMLADGAKRQDIAKKFRVSLLTLRKALNAA